MSECAAGFAFGATWVSSSGCVTSAPFVIFDGGDWWRVEPTPRSTSPAEGLTDLHRAGRAALDVWLHAGRTGRSPRHERTPGAAMCNHAHGAHRPPGPWSGRQRAEWSRRR